MITPLTALPLTVPARVYLPAFLPFPPPGSHAVPVQAPAAGRRTIVQRRADALDPEAAGRKAFIAVIQIPQAGSCGNGFSLNAIIYRTAWPMSTQVRRGAPISAGRSGLPRGRIRDGRRA